MLSVAALSIHNFIHSVGSDVGFASIIAVALLIVLYFAHARETANLRDGLDEAHQRIESLDLRLQQLLHQQSMARQQQGQPTIAPAPLLAARPAAGAVAALRRSPAASGVTAASLGLLIPAAVYGAGAPSLGSATKLIPDPKPAVGAPVVVGAGGLRASTAATGAGETVVGQPVVVGAAGPAPLPGRIWQRKPAACTDPYRRSRSGGYRRSRRERPAPHSSARR